MSLSKFESIQKLLRALLMVSLVGTMAIQTGCSSSDTAEDSSEESADLDSEESGDDSGSEDSGSESADAEEKSEEGGEESAEAEGGEEGEAEGGEEAAEKEEGEAEGGEEVAEEGGDEELEEGEEGDGEAVAKTEEAPPAPVEKVEEPTPPPAVAEAPPAESAPVDAAPEPPPMPKVSLKKIKDAPFDIGGTILNTVYVARPGDNVRGIAKKLGVGRNELVRWNSHIAGGVKAGDKVYYRSQTRPDDTSTMLTYYEDKGIPAQNYEAQDGENIRAIAKKLIGSSEGWKELWATNLQVESKGELPGGTVLRYWPEDATPVAAAPPPEPPAPTPPPVPAPPPPPPVAQTPPPSDPNQGLPQQPLDNTNPDAAAMGSVGAPPPPGPRPKPKGDVAQADALGLSEENIYLIGGGGLVLLTLLFMVAAIRKKKARQLADSQTQI